MTNITHLFKWSFTIYLYIPLLILQISLLVYSNEILNSKVNDEKLIGERIINVSPKVTTFLSIFDAEKSNYSNKNNSIHIDKSQHRSIDKKLNNQINITTKIYDKINSLSTKNFNDNKSSSSDVQIINRNYLNSYNTNSPPLLVNSILQSFFNSMWTLFYKPLINIITSKVQPNLPNNINNLPLSLIRKLKYKETQNTPILNNTYVVSYESNNWRLLLPDLTAEHSLNNSKNNSEIIYDTRIEPSTVIPDTAVTKSNNYTSIINEFYENLLNSENNSFNDDSTFMFVKAMMLNNNDSKIRSPFSSRYSQIYNTSDEIKKQKREIPLNNDYNLAARHELSSYYYNDQKIRENYPNYEKIVNKDNSSLYIENPANIYDTAGIDQYPHQRIYMRNQDDYIKELLDKGENLDSNIEKNVYINVNDSSLFYPDDKFNYSIFHNINKKMTTTQKTVEYKIIYSRNKSPQSRRTISQKTKQINVKKNVSKKNMGNRRQSNSMRKKKNKIQRGKNMRNGRKKKSSIKSGKTRNNLMKNTTKTFNNNRRNNMKNILKKKRKVPIQRKNNNKKSERNYKRTKQLTYNHEQLQQ